jgi:hypothetical protein
MGRVKIREYKCDGRKRRYALPRDFLQLHALDVTDNGVRYAVKRYTETERRTYVGWRPTPLFLFLVDGKSLRVLPKLKRPQTMTLYYEPCPKRPKWERRGR